MAQILLIIHLLLALFLIATVLMQRSEGAGLGLGGGPNASGSGRPAATAAQKFTWGLIIAFMSMSLALTIIAARDAKDASAVDRVLSTSGDASNNDPLDPSAVLGVDSLAAPVEVDPSAPLTPTADE